MNETTYPENLIANATVSGQPNVLVLRRKTYTTLARSCRYAWAYDWAHTNVKGRTCSNDREVTDIIPLTVLDPTHPDFDGLLPALRDAVSVMKRKALTGGYAASAWGRNAELVRVLHDKFEWEAKRFTVPEEPTGDWAAVEDRDGNRWIRDPRSPYPVAPWRNLDSGHTLVTSSWQSLVRNHGPVKVLSEGVGEKP